MSAILAEQAPLEVDNGPFSDYESNGHSELSTESLTSSIRAYVYENGRRYHTKSSGKYHMPSDETEQDRLDLEHHLITLIHGGEIYKAPLKQYEDPPNVLDAGCGTGVWALDFGDMHPGSQVIGVDLAPIQPSWTYPNVKFECDDLEKEWTYKPDYFQYIHSRFLATAIKDWPRYFQQCFKHTSKGGYVEIVEHPLDHLDCDDDTLEGSKLNEYLTKFANCLSKTGIKVDINVDFFKQGLEEAGFVNLQVYATRVPWGAWPKGKVAKRVGAINHLNLETGMEAYGLAVFTNYGGMTEEESKALIVDAFKDVAGRKVHAYNWVWTVVGQKPE